MALLTVVCRIVIAILVLFSALIVFPNYIPAFAGLWLVYCTVCTFRRKKLAVEFAAIPIWLFVKWPEATFPLLIFVLSSCAAALVSALETNNRNSLLVIVWITWAIWLSHHHLGMVSNTKPVTGSGPVVCLGDSLTDYGYPQGLAMILDRPVADFGFNGYTVDDGLKLVPEINALKPSVVIIELGGHDFKNGEPRNETQGKLRSMIMAFEDSGSRVILVEIPRGFVVDPWYGMERELAREFDLELVHDCMIRRLIFWSPIIPPGSLVSADMRLSDDGLHPNRLGNKMMAEAIAQHVMED